MKNILFVVTNADTIGTGNIKTGYEFSEIADPYFEFVNAGFTIDFASINGGATPEYGYDEKQSNSKLFRESKGFAQLNDSLKLENIAIKKYDAIFFPGGLGPMVDMVNNNVLKNTISQFYKSGKIISAVCHGTVAFLHVKLNDGTFLINGKRITCFSSKEEEIKKHFVGSVIPFLLDEALKKHGAVYSKAAPFEQHVVIDKNIITGQNPPSASAVAKAIIESLLNY
jgi:putative intracellular protease/amidase